MKKYFVSLCCGVMLFGCTPTTEDTYISACKEGGASTKMCSCVYQKLKAKYGDEKLQYFLDNSPETISEAPQFLETMILATERCVAQGVR